MAGPGGGGAGRDARKSRVKQAYFLYRKGVTPAGELLDPAKGPAQYLPHGVVGLPFPAGTRELAATLPPIVELEAYLLIDLSLKLI